MNITGAKITSISPEPSRGTPREMHWRQVVSGNDHLGPDELPPRPDLSTGLPRPPHAPTLSRVFAVASADSNREHDPAKTASPPVGHGPPLAWYRSSRRGALKIAALGFAFVSIILTLNRGLIWIGMWQVWIVFLVIFIAIYSASLKAEQCAAGADWLAKGKHWVDIYKLKDVAYHIRRGEPELTLIDSENHRMQITLLALQQDRDIWDLTYNGILHSVIAGGAHTNQEVHRSLMLPRCRQ